MEFLAIIVLILTYPAITVISMNKTEFIWKISVIVILRAMYVIEIIGQGSKYGILKIILS